MFSLQSIVARNRFGLGTIESDGELSDPRGWLSAQLAPQSALPPSLAGLPGTLAAMAATEEIIQARKAARMDAAGADTPAIAARDAQGDTLAGLYAQQVMARFAAAVVTTTPFRERLVHFWTNHFAVSAEKVRIKTLVGSFEIEAIRAHLDGSFSDMLAGAVQHPAMLLYLDNVMSFGPNSSFVQRRQGNTARTLGLNENLAREILELYTLGVRTGYTQSDVTELARAITGWSVVEDRPQFAKLMEPGLNNFAYYPPMHEPGRRRLLGKAYDEEGQRQGLAMLRDLGSHPATAHHIATKLVRHFVADDPPPRAVVKIERAFAASHGHLPSIHRALISLDEVWATNAQPKYKTPWEYVVSVGRLAGLPDFKPGKLVAMFAQMGQAVYMPGAPAGWPDVSANWLSSDGLSKRIQFATEVAHIQASHIDARAQAERAFGPQLTGSTRLAIDRAESGQQALTLLLASPEMMWR